MRVHWRDEPVVEWCWTDGIAFSEPVFTQTIDRALQTPFSLLFRRETPIDDLEPGPDPAGFVLHGSRCGSTLVSAMLAAVPRHLVLSEAPPVDQVLRAGGLEEDRIRWLRGIVAALGRRRRGDEPGRLRTLSFDAWSAPASLGTCALRFPDVPWVFVFRDPVQVLASHLRQRGAHMVPGAIDPEIFGLDSDSISRMPPEEYCARVLASICRAGVEHRDGQALFVDHDELPGAPAERILGAFGPSATRERARMEEVTAFDAKNPSGSS